MNSNIDCQYRHVCHSQVMMYLLHYGREVNAKEEAHNVASPTNAF